MVTSTLNIGSLATPRTAPSGPGRFARALKAMWQAGEYIGQQRAALYLNGLADTYADTKPEFAQRMRAAAAGRHYD